MHVHLLENIALSDGYENKNRYPTGGIELMLNFKNSCLWLYPKNFHDFFTYKQNTSNAVLTFKELREYYKYISWLPLQ